MVDKLDGADVLMISNKGHYGYIDIDDSDNANIKVFYLAICKYADADNIYLFLCNEDMHVEQDVDFGCIDDAIVDAQRRFQTPICWTYNQC